MMNQKTNHRRGWSLLVLALLLGLPGTPAKAATFLRALSYFEPIAMQSSGSEQQDREQEKRDREQDLQDRDQEKQDREQEKRDKGQEKLDRQQELYDEGREALDDQNYEKAEQKFDALARLNGPQTDAALYWKAYAESRLGKRDAMTATLADLNRRFPQSRWIKDGKALVATDRPRNGVTVDTSSENDCELKMLAMQGAMNSDADRAVPILEKFIASGAAPRCKSKALFVLAESGSPKAREVLGRIARGQSNPELQRKAVEYLGIFGGEESRQTLSNIYATASDPSLKRAILRAFMISGDRGRLFAAAKSESNEDVRREAIRQLGISGGDSELEQLYQSEKSLANKKEILQAFFLAGRGDRLLQIAQTDSNMELRRAAIRNLGLISTDKTGQDLRTIYDKESDRSLRKEVLNALFIQGNVKGLIEIARKEKDPELKKDAVGKLSLMGSKEATDFLMEILNQP